MNIINYAIYFCNMNLWLSLPASVSNYSEWSEGEFHSVHHLRPSPLIDASQTSSTAFVFLAIDIRIQVKVTIKKFAHYLGINLWLPLVALQYITTYRWSAVQVM